MVYWYSNLFSVCKWQNAYSNPFSVASGVRQGGVLSAKVFAVYLNDLVLELRKIKNGCHIADIFVACILYADDLCLLAPTRKSLQLLLDTCSRYADVWCIKYNEKKTKVMVFGKDFKTFTCCPFYLNNNQLEFVTEWKYLGVFVTSDKLFSCSAKNV